MRYDSPLTEFCTIALILVDDTYACLGQSSIGPTERAHTSLMRSDPETAQMKIVAYAAIWQSAVDLPL